MIAENAVARAVERRGDADGRDLLADAGMGRPADATERELIEQQLLEAADGEREPIMIGQRGVALGDRKPRRIRGAHRGGSGLSARSSASQNCAT